MTDKDSTAMEKIGKINTVWGDIEEKRNVELCFCCLIEKQEEVLIEMIARDVYNLFVNGQFVAYGPGRAAKGYSRIERLDITSYLTEQENAVCVYVQSNCTNTLAFTKEHPLFGARIWSEGRLVKETEDFRCYRMTDKISEVERMSSQRGFVEVYHMEQERASSPDRDFPQIRVKTLACPQLLERAVSYSENLEEQAELLRIGSAYIDKTKTWENDFTKLLDSGTELDCYSREACECVLSRELLSLCFDREERAGGLSAAIYRFPRVLCGKFKLKVTVRESSAVWLTYDDVLTDGAVSFNREEIIHGIKWELGKGEYTLYSQEVYSAQYIQLVTDGDVEVEKVSVIRIENPDASNCAIPEMEQELYSIVEAAKNTFVQNAYDILTDCPSRERSGWLCDSYFLGKAEHFFTGKNLVEKNFLENYLLYENEVFQHRGVLPMCYPSYPAGPESYIPGWMLWYLLELEDYLQRTGDSEFISRHRERVRDIIDFFQRFENEYGLLEDLEGWVFLEWSRATDYAEGVNFPSNMLYADALRAAGVLLEDGGLIQKSVVLKQRIREWSYDGEVFVDNAVRVDGKLYKTDNRSELCQIFAAFFGIAEDDSTFYEAFKSRFSTVSSQKQISPCAVFIGGILRILTLFQMEEYQLLLKECREEFIHMAEKTGTIWEFSSEKASCNHGFGSVLGQIICESVKQIKKTERGLE